MKGIQMKTDSSLCLLYSPVSELWELLRDLRIIVQGPNWLQMGRGSAAS